MPQTRRPNIVLVLTDDQGYPPLGAHGHPYLRTPHLDRFHAQAARFEQCHSGTTCAPTRAGLFTGHYCNSTGVWHTVGGRSLLRADEWTLADALRGAGWRTGLFGKWHLGDEYPYRPQDRGFDLSIVHGGGGVGQTPDWWGNDYFDDTYRVNGTPTSFQGYCTDVFFDEAWRFLSTAPDQPALCVIATNAPHSPFNVPRHWWEPYRLQAKTEAYARFLGMIANIDDNFGRLRRRLAQAEMERDTVLMFASDNGQCPLAAMAEPEAWNSGLRGMKGSMYEGGHRIPLLMRWPAGGIDSGRSIDALSAYIDLMPTVLDLAQVTIPEEHRFHGVSLAGLARGEPPGEALLNRILVTDTQRVPQPIKWRLSCVMQGSWRLINGEALYDLSCDPGQRTDVAAAHPHKVTALRAAYEDWWTLCQRQAEDPIPISVGARPETLLNSHDLRNDQGDGVWNQGQVRLGQLCSGYWEIQVERSGLYGIELRRWPREAAHALTSGIEGDDIAFHRDGVSESDVWWYSGGTALPITEAATQIDEQPEMVCPVDTGACAAHLKLRLDAGPHRLRAWFRTSDGVSFSPYYVALRSLGAVEVSPLG